MIRAYQPFTKTVRALSLLITALAMLFASTAALAQTMASSVSQHGITWYFDQEYEVGQYANGDWWVLGPVTITRITPESTIVDGRVMNGSMLNPPIDGSGRQGYDSYDSDISYASELNVAPSMSGSALQLKEGSIVSSISQIPPGTRGRPLLSDLAILTVVPEMPPASAFRPFTGSTDKTSHWTEADLDYSILRSLPKVEHTPSLQDLSQRALRFWNPHHTNWEQRAVHARNNQGIYGREIQNEVAEMVLSLHLNYSNAEKRDLFVGLVQMGLDIYGRAVMGGRWSANGGHNAGRKLPLILAGLALDDEAILWFADPAHDQNRFQEDCQVFTVTEEDVGREVNNETYLEEDVGMAEWGIRHCDRPASDNRSWDARYRWIGAGMVGNSLAARLTTGGMQAWNWEPYFEYADRYIETDTQTGRNGIQPFQRSMWETYRYHETDSAAPSSPPAAPVAQVE